MRSSFQDSKPTWFYRFISGLTRYVWFWPLGGIESVDEHYVPKSGPVLLCPNHVSYADPPACSCGSRRGMNSMGKAELFDVPILKYIVRGVGCFPVKRGAGDSEAIRYALDILGRGAMLLVFPEGSRNDGKTLRPISSGVAMMAKRSGAQVVPAAIVGTHIQLPKGRKIPRRAHVKVVYGEPFTYADVATSASERENRERFVRELAERIVALATANGMPLTISSSMSHVDGSHVPETATESPTASADELPIPQ